MSNYILNNTAEEIDLAIGKVANATTTPLDDNSNMVTSGGVKAYVDTQVGALNTTVNDLVAQSNVTNNVASLFATPISTTGPRNQTSVSLNIGEFSQYSTTVALQSVDYVLCALYIYVGNNDSNTIYNVSIRDINAYSCLSATSVKYGSYSEEPSNVSLYLHDIILIPTLGFTSGNYQFDYNMTGTDTWNIRVDLTGFIGKPA